MTTAPALDDTILAVSSGWQPAPLGIIRLSGPQTRAVLHAVDLSPPNSSQPIVQSVRASPSADLVLPAELLWFPSPRSYTGQDVAELHTVGCLPLLRVLSERLLAAGARRALPGEFTARAFLAGKLDAGQVEAVLGLIHADGASAARHAVRLRRDSSLLHVRQATDRVADALALIEAGIDFVEEDDVHFIRPPDLCAIIDDALSSVQALLHSGDPCARRGRSHVALAGLPNAGKSTLFNALLGHERAIVSPVVGTTRDVLSAELTVAGAAIVLQDCAGLGDTETELELAAHAAAERAAAQADIVLWVHDAARPWHPRELAALAAIAPDRCVLILSKIDCAEAAATGVAPAVGAVTVHVSAATGDGLDSLRSAIGRRLESHEVAGAALLNVAAAREALVALQRARELVTASTGVLRSPELIALELRTALEATAPELQVPVPELVLERIFARFCVGK